MVKSSGKQSVTIAALNKRLNYTAHIIAIKQFLSERGFNVNFILNTKIYPTNKYVSTSFFKNEYLFIIFPFTKMLLFVILRKLIKRNPIIGFMNLLHLLVLIESLEIVFFGLLSFT